MATFSLATGLRTTDEEWLSKSAVDLDRRLVRVHPDDALLASRRCRTDATRYSNGRPCLPARATACALTRSALAGMNGLTLRLSISRALNNCGIDKPAMIGR